MMHRRNLLGSIGALPALVTARAWAATGDQPRLLVVFLRGGYDAANVVIPTSSSFYYEARPKLQIARPNPRDPNSGLVLDGEWSLHPALNDRLYALWTKRQLAFVPFAGPTDLSRSHFVTQDSIELGEPDGAGHGRSGFLGRLATLLTGARPIAFTDQLPVSFRGCAGVPNLNLGSITQPELYGRTAALVGAMYAGDKLSSSISTGLKIRAEAYEKLSSMGGPSNSEQRTPQGFERVARGMASLMRSEFNLGLVNVGGWDTHVNTGGASGYLASRLQDLGRGLATFAHEMGPPAWRRTVVVVLSEFGRTLRENGDGGTDHGHGTVCWVLGGSVRGGRMAGPQIATTASTLNENRDWPVLTNYRSLLGGLLKRMYGLNARQLGSVFPQAKPADLRLV